MPNSSKPLGIGVQIGENAANIGGIERQVDNRIRPIELLLEFLRTRRLANHDCPCGRALVESGRDLVVASRELGFVHIAAICDEVAAAFEEAREHAAMFLRIIDVERAVLEVHAARNHGVVVIEALPSIRVLEQRLVGDLRAPADVANLDRAGLVAR